MTGDVRGARYIVGLVAALAMLLAFATGIGVADEATPQAAPAVTREVINEGYPGAAPGQVLQLVRYTIAPDTSLPVHIHPGMQVAVIESGVLTYTVVEGEVAVTRASGADETLLAGQTTAFLPGDRFVEAQGMVHFGENRGDEPVVILVASLFAADQPPSTVVEAATPAP